MAASCCQQEVGESYPYGSEYIKICLGFGEPEYASAGTSRTKALGAEGALGSRGGVRNAVLLSDPSPVLLHNALRCC